MSNAINVDEAPGALSAIQDAAAAKEIGKIWRTLQARSGAASQNQNNLPDHVYVTRGDLKALQQDVSARIDKIAVPPTPVASLRPSGGGAASASGSPLALSSLTLTATSAGVNQNVALLVTAGAGGGYYRAAIALGQASPALTCDVGIDMGFLRVNTAAIVVPDGAPIVLSPGAAALVRYSGNQFTFEAGGNVKSFISMAGELGITTLTAVKVNTTLLSAADATVGTLTIMEPGGGATAGAFFGYFDINLGGFMRRVPFYAQS